MSGFPAELVVVGPGAMGCLLAARLVGAGRSVGLLDHDTTRAARLERDGLCVSGVAGERRVAIHAAADAAAFAPPAAVLLCVKAPDTAAAIHAAAPLVGAGTVVASLQNGLGNLEVCAAVVPADRLIAGTMSLGALSLGVGRVRETGCGPVGLAAPLGEAVPARDRLADLLRRSGLEVRVWDDARTLLWTKLVVNAAVNPVAALADVPNGDVIRRGDLVSTARAAAMEAAAVAAALGVALPFDDAWAEVRRVCLATAANRCSMLQDIAGGRPTEIDAINGAVSRGGRAVGVPTPVNDSLVDAVRRRTAVGRPSQATRQRP